MLDKNFSAQFVHKTLKLIRLKIGEVGKYWPFRPGHQSQLDIQRLFRPGARASVSVGHATAIPPRPPVSVGHPTAIPPRPSVSAGHPMATPYRLSVPAGHPSCQSPAMRTIAPYAVRLNRHANGLSAIPSMLSPSLIVFHSIRTACLSNLSLMASVFTTRPSTISPTPSVSSVGKLTAV